VRAELQRRQQHRILRYYPDTGPLRRELYPKHMEFFRAGATARERLMLAANRIGKTEGLGAYEVTLHLTGRYPAWWEGRRFDHEIVRFPQRPEYLRNRSVDGQLHLVSCLHGDCSNMTRCARRGPWFALALITLLAIVYLSNRARQVTLSRETEGLVASNAAASQSQSPPGALPTTP